MIPNQFHAASTGYHLNETVTRNVAGYGPPISCPPPRYGYHLCMTVTRDVVGQPIRCPRLPRRTEYQSPAPRCSLPHPSER